jgi:hypothetical protein
VEAPGHEQAGRPAPPAPAGKGSGAGWPLAFAIAAALSCWNPVAAPFALVVGVAAAVMGGRALRRGGRRAAAAALALGILAAAASIAILGLTAGAVGVELPGEAVVQGRSAAEMNRVLDDAARRTRDQRDRALRELEKLAPPDAGAPHGGKP